jgi:hypothetical protein
MSSSNFLPGKDAGLGEPRISGLAPAITRNPTSPVFFVFQKAKQSVTNPQHAENEGFVAAGHSHSTELSGNAIHWADRMALFCKKFPMTRICSLLSAIVLSSVFPAVQAKDAIYSLKDEAPTGMAVDKDELVLRMPLQALAPPKAKRITLIEAQGSHEGDYILQIDLAAAPPKNLRPVVVLGERTLVEGVMVGGSDEAGYTITLGSNDLTTARDWLKRLQVLFGLPDSQVIDHSVVDQSKLKK